MENIIPRFDRTFNYLIEPQDSWKLGKDVAAFYNVAQNVIVIRSDVYEGAQNGSYIDVITVAHEVVHCIQSIILTLELCTLQWKFLQSQKLKFRKTESSR